MVCLLLQLSVSALVAAASGCKGGVPKDLHAGHVVRRSWRQTDSDARLGDYDREYMIQLPEGYTGEVAVPVLVYMHGWGDDFKCNGCHFKEVANKNNFIVVKPNGMSDGQQNLRSWNVGQAGRTDICVHKDVAETEYSSCLTTKNTSVCNCGTCYDDVRFLSDLGVSLMEELCIDEDRIFATGGSFGAMMAYFLAPELHGISSPWKLRGILPWYGAFYRNMNEVPQALAATSVFHFHGIHDTEVTMDGSESDDGYLFDPVNMTLTSYATINGCQGTSDSIKTPYDGQGTGENRLLGCFEYSKCSTGARVVRCHFDGGHGIWPEFAEEMMWWFASSLPAREFSVTI